MASALQFKIAAQLDSQGFKDAAAAVRDMGKAAWRNRRVKLIALVIP